MSLDYVPVILRKGKLSPQIQINKWNFGIILIQIDVYLRVLDFKHVG